MTKRDEAIQKANAALDVLKEIDDLLLEASNTKMAAVFERVLTNNQPAAGSMINEVNWIEAPAHMREAWLRAAKLSEAAAMGEKERQFRRILPRSAQEITELHSEECYEEVR